MSNTGGFSFGNTAVPPSTANRNPPASTQASGFGGFSLPSLATTTSGFSLPSVTSTAATAPTLNFYANPTSSTSVSTAASSGPVAFGSSFPASSTAKNISFPFNTSSSSTTAPTSKSGVQLSTTSSVSSTASASATSTISSTSANKSINYLQLQDLTNKWIADSEDLQKMLTNQTSETINRDVILASNEDKIENLVDSVQNLKLEQTKVEQQLDFILSQQKDLEECLASLEDEVSSYFPELPADDMYKLAENIDSRLKKTLETSKEIITKINDKNRSSENITNPMVAIGRILNHLTNSIQMLENLNIEGQTKLNNLQKYYQQFI